MQFCKQQYYTILLLYYIRFRLGIRGSFWYGQYDQLPKVHILLRVAKAPHNGQFLIFLGGVSYAQIGLWARSIWCMCTCSACCWRTGFRGEGKFVLGTNQAWTVPAGDWNCPFWLNGTLFGIHRQTIVDLPTVASLLDFVWSSSILESFAKTPATLCLFYIADSFLTPVATTHYRRIVKFFVPILSLARIGVGITVAAWAGQRNGPDFFVWPSVQR